MDHHYQVRHGERKYDIARSLPGYSPFLHEWLPSTLGRIICPNLRGRSRFLCETKPHAETQEQMQLLWINKRDASIPSSSTSPCDAVLLMTFAGFDRFDGGKNVPGIGVLLKTVVQTQRFLLLSCLEPNGFGQSQIESKYTQARCGLNFAARKLMIMESSSLFDPFLYMQVYARRSCPCDFMSSSKGKSSLCSCHSHQENIVQCGIYYPFIFMPSRSSNGPHEYFPN